MATTLWAVEGFEQMATSNGVAINAPLATKWPQSSLGSSCLSIAGRNAGGRALELNQFAGHFDIELPSTGSGVYETIVGFAFKILTTVPTSGITGMVTIQNGGGNCVGINLNTSKQLQLTRLSAGTVIATTAWTVVADTWYYVELRAFVNDTTGQANLWVNGTAEGSATGVDTNSSLVTGEPELIRFNNLNTSGHIVLDDIYVQTGSSLTPYGACKVLGLSPVADGGDTSFTPSTGSDHYATVDEIPPATADYNQVASPTTGQRDTFTLGTLSDINTIVGIQHNIGCSITAGSTTLKGSTKTSGSRGASAAKTITNANGNRILRGTSVVDPNSSTAWTASTVNTSEFGYEVG